jgi:hypothetical protein
MRGAIIPLPNTPSWRGAQLNTGTPLHYFIIIIIIISKIMQGSTTCFFLIPGQVLKQSSVWSAGSSRSMTLPSLDAARRSQRPYRYGMILLCVGALINWLGLAENYVEPVRYIGVACIIAGAMLICAAMCCWLQRPASEHADNISQVNSTHELLGVIPCGTCAILICAADKCYRFARSEARTVFDRSNTGITGSNPAGGRMYVCMYAFFCVVLSCVGRGLASG